VDDAVPLALGGFCLTFGGRCAGNLSGGAGEGVPDEPTREGVSCYQQVSKPDGAEDRVPEDVEHVVSVVGQGEGVDDGVELDDGQGEDDCAEDVRDVVEFADHLYNEWFLCWLLLGRAVEEV